MNLRQYSPIWNLILIVLVMYGVHKTVFYFFSIHTAAFYYSLETVYLFFLLSALVVFFIVLKIKERNFDQIGMTFMLLTSIKTVFSYIMLRPVLKLVPPESPIEKNNFFMTFVVFLLIETLLTIRILNQKGQNSK
jgi:hypothetical protein